MWLRVWWTNRNPKLVTSYFLAGCREVGGEFCDRLVFRWLAVPWIQRELDHYVAIFNNTPRRADKHKLLPQGIPNLIQSKPHQFGCTDYKASAPKTFIQKRYVHNISPQVVITPELFDQLDAQWAPADDPVFELTPPSFHAEATAIFQQLGNPTVDRDTFWFVYVNMLDAFDGAVFDDRDSLDRDMEAADDYFEDDIELMPGQADLRPGAPVIGSAAANVLYEYVGGLSAPPSIPADQMIGPSERQEGEEDPDAFDDFAEVDSDTTMAQPLPAGDIAVTFTPGEQRICQRSACEQVGRSVCANCLQYYRNKGSSFSTLHLPELDPAQQQAIRAQVSAAQRNSRRSSLHDWGARPSALPQQTQQAPNRSSSRYASRMDGPSAPTSSAPYYASGPQSGGVAGSGYTLNHVGYLPERARRASQAYAAQGGYVVIVEGRMSYMTVSNPKAKYLGILEVINDILLHIGATELKQRLWAKLYEAWLAFTYGRPLSLEEITLRDDKWVALLPRLSGPDVDCIASKFFTVAKNGAAPQFRSKKIVIHLAVSAEIGDAAAFAASVADQQAYHDGNNTFSEPPPSMPAAPKRRNKQKPRSKKQVFFTGGSSAQASTGQVFSTGASTSTQQSSGPPASAAGASMQASGSQLRQLTQEDNEEPPVSASRLWEGKRGADHAWARRRRSWDTRPSTLTGVLWQMREYHSLKDLQQMNTHWESTLMSPGSVASVVISSDPAVCMKGSFKTAIAGTITPSFQGDEQVVVKQTYFETTGLKIAGKPDVVRHVAHDNGRQVSLRLRMDIVCLSSNQAKLLMMELRCLIWGTVLLERVYRFMREFMADNHVSTLPMTVPPFRFVKAAMLVRDSEEMYLVEECIGGNFRKFINNRAAVPLPGTDPDDVQRVEFLCFAQHVQYQVTFKKVFVSDFQGEPEYLLFRNVDA
ncbi:hypothetical protein C8R46DRAFT_920349 [Mycena filopes]|nr:hypothetical protein C8R46DRAFT_920349 [Mycena filopes]